jgi:hypothetical protein
MLGEDRPTEHEAKRPKGLQEIGAPVSTHQFPRTEYRNALRYNAAKRLNQTRRTGRQG